MPPGSASLEPHPITLEEMLDTMALQRLAWTYCHAIDRRDYRLLRSLYHDDAVDDHGEMFCGTPDQYVAWLPSMLAQWEATSHVISNTLFLIDGARAEGQLVTAAYHRSADGLRELSAHGRYLDVYEKRGGVWKFLRRSLVLDRISERAVSTQIEVAGSRLGIAIGRASNNDPCFLRLPMFSACGTAEALR